MFLFVLNFHRTTPLRNTRKKCEIYSKLTIKIPEQRHRRCSGVFIVNSEHITPCSGVSIVDFEQVNVSWVSFSINQVS